MDGRARDRDTVKALQVVDNPSWAEMVMLPQVQDLPQRRLAVWRWANDGALGHGPPGRDLRARYNAPAICKTFSGKSRSVGRSTPRCAHLAPRGAAVSANGSIASALQSSSRLHS